MDLALMFVLAHTTPLGCTIMRYSRIRDRHSSASNDLAWGFGALVVTITNQRSSARTTTTF
jgi:hypothetical protein